MLAMFSSRRQSLIKRSRHHLSNNTTFKFPCIAIAFITVVVILVLSVIYFAATFPLVENKEQVSKAVNPSIIDIDMQHNINIHKKNVNNNDGNKYNVYNESQMISIRSMHTSPVHLDASPFLVGLGAEKSGSTSLGAAMFNSGEFKSHNRDEIDVETKYWSDCFNWNQWNADGTRNALIQRLNDNQAGRCSIAQYQSYGLWKNGKFKFEKSVDYLGLPYVTRIFSDIFVKQHGTKIFVMIRYAPPRISSTWKFFVGAEKDKMPNEYGNVERFTRHLLKNEVLKELIDLLDVKNGAITKTLFDLDWTNVILPKWNQYMLSLLEQCQQEAKIAQFNPSFCNPSQLLRRAVGLSCYIVPIMQWIIDLGIENAINNFRIIQSELYFENGKEIMDRLICWSKSGTMDVNKCDTASLYKSGRISIKKLQGTIKQSTDFTDELTDILHSVFEPCNVRLSELFQFYPQLALKQFIWNHWHFEPSFVSI